MALLLLLPAIAALAYSESQQHREAHARAAADVWSRVAAHCDPGTSPIFETGALAGLPFPEVDRRIHRSMWLLGLLSAALIGAALAAGELFVVRPIEALTGITARLAAGDLGARAPEAPATPGIADIGAAVNAMAVALETRRDELRDSEERYRRLFHENPQPMAVYDTETLQFVEVNDAAIRQYGYTREEFLLLTVRDIRPPEDVPRLLAMFAASTEPTRHSGLWRHRLKSGAVIDVEIVSLALTFNGRPCRLVLERDVTERLKAERAQSFLASMIEDSDDAIIGAGVDGTILSWNAGAERLYGYSAVEAIGQHVALIVPDDRRDEPAGLLARVAAGEHVKHFETIRRRKSRMFVPVSITLSPIRASDGAIVGAATIARDMTDRVAAERALQDAEERMRFALEAAGIGIWQVDFTGGTAVWSEKCETMHGLAPGAYSGTFDAFLRQIHPEDRDAVRTAIERAAREHAEPLLEYRTTWPDGSVHYISSTGRFFYDETGAAVRGAGVATDVTERRVLERQLRQAQKMEAVGQLAGGIAHDFNNMLTAILGNAEFALDELPDGHPCRDSVQEIMKAGQRSAALTQQLLAFSRKQILTLRVLHMGDVVSEVTPMLRRLLGETIDLRTATADRGHVKADAGQLQQVLMNLVVNARDAMPNGGRLTIETADVWRDETYARQHPSVRAGAAVMLAVTDSGCGMDAATRQRIFEPFFTTKPMGQGTGLGLATVYGIVKQSGGDIWVYSEVGRGTTFKVYLPRTDAPEDGVQAATRAARPPRGAETVLLVEDEDVVRELVVRILTRHGYQVHAAAEPSQAIAWSSAHRDHVHLILSDVVLPGMSGRAMAALLKTQHPESKILYTSGYTDHAIVHQGVLDEGTAFIQKPFTADGLLAKVRAVLDAPTAET
jgi:PAS domain S-box-containing protein